MGKQHTLAAEVSIAGAGLHTGEDVNMTMKPTEMGGIVFNRIDLPDEEPIAATISNVSNTTRGTTIGKGTNTVSTIEHVMAALGASGVTHAEVEIDGPECPIMDGSAKPFMDAIGKVGTTEIGKEETILTITSNIEFKDEESGSSYLILPSDKLKFTVMIDYGKNSLPPQHAILNDLSDFKNEIAPSRTFCFLHELEYLLENNLVKGGALDNAIVYVEDGISEEKRKDLSAAFGNSELNVTPGGILNNTELRFPNESARHKLLDLMGDLALVGAKVNGHIIATKPGHTGNVKFGKFLTDMIKANRRPKAPRINLNAKPLFGINEIMARLPHRPPFLFIDKIMELSDTHVVGVKNVTMNEEFFKGHFPGAPVMPGVIQIEAMAQAGGILVLGTVPNPENYLTYFMKIESVKFRKMVLPGDTLVFKLDLLSPIRRGICHMKGYAYVGNEPVMEAEMMARIQKKEAE